MGKLAMFFLFTFGFIGSELEDSFWYFAFMFILIVLLIFNLVIVKAFAMGRLISFWISTIFLSVVYAYDFMLYSTPKEKEVFYIPMLIELLILLASFLLYIFEVPERWCRGGKFCQLYLTGYIFFTIFFINFLFEAQAILYDTLKLNNGTYDENTDDWYRMANVFHNN